MVFCQRDDLFLGRVRRELQRLWRHLAQRIGVTPGDAEKIAVYEHRKASAKRLRYITKLAFCKSYACTGRHSERAAITPKSKGFVVTAVRIHCAIVVACGQLPADLGQCKIVMLMKVRGLPDS